MGRGDFGPVSFPFSFDNGSWPCVAFARPIHSCLRLSAIQNLVLHPILATRSSHSHLMGRNGAFCLLVLTVTLTFCALVHSIPSFDVSRTIICQDGDITNCMPRLRVLAAISSFGATWSVDFKLPSTAIFTGPLNTTWGANGTDSASFSISRLKTRLNIPLAFVGSYATLTVEEGRVCASGLYCCTGSDGILRTFKLVEVVTAKKYDVFRTIDPISEWDLNINVTIGNTSSLVSLSNSMMKGAWPENMEDPLLSSRAIPLEAISSISTSLLRNRFMAVDPTWARPPFYIPEARMDSESHWSYSMTQASFGRLMMYVGGCSLSVAKSLVAISEGTDSFAPYFDLNVNHGLLDSLVSLSASRVSPASPPHSLIINLNGRATTLVEMVLNSDNYTMTPISAEPVATGGYGYMQAETGTFHAFLDITNAGRTPGYVQIDAGRCCYAPTNASNPTLSCAYLLIRSADLPQSQGQFMAASETIRFRFQQKIDLSGQSGYCTFSFYGDSSGTRTYDVGFPMKTDTTTPSTPTAPCESPFIPLPEPPFCQSPCTVDQIYNTTTSECDPVDCVKKYKGGRPHYDLESGLCKPYIAPPPTATPSEAPTAIPAIIVPTNGTPSFPMAPDGTYSIYCGEHGTYNAQSMTCNCEAGWITDMDQPVSDFEFCSVQSIFTPGQIYDSQKPPSKGTVNYVKLIVAVSITFVCVLVIALIAGYVLSKRKKDEDDDDSSSASDSL